jgi:uroporphyrinogen decarboxylase
MKGKERVLCAIRRGQPDCVPVLPQIWLDHAARISGIDPLDIIERPHRGFRAMLATARHYGLDGFRTFLIYDPRTVVREGEKVYEVDPKTGEKIGLVDMQGGWGVKPFAPPAVVRDAADVARIPVPPARTYWDDGRCGHLAEVVAEAGEDHLVVGRPLGFTMNWLLAQRGGDALSDLYDDPPLVHALFEKGLAIALEMTRAMHRAGVQLFMMGDAASSCDMISPRHFQQFVAPYYKLFCDEVHRLGALVYVHVCGNQTLIAEMLADTGVDAIEPMDPMGGVDPADMRRRVGDRVALMGGVSTMTLLQGSPAEVEAEARACILKAGRSGAYLLAAGCMVPRDTPEANLRALVRAGHELGRYPLPA